MKYAICASFNAGLPLARAIPLIRQAGFEVISLAAEGAEPSYLSSEGRREISRLVAEHGVRIDSLHAPYPKADRLFSLYDADRQEALRLCMCAIDAAQELDCPAVVIHLIQPYGIPEGDARRRMIDAGRKSIGLLLSHASKREVKIAMENGQEAAYDETLCRFLEEFDSEQVGLCYDTGHANVLGRCFWLLEELGSRLLTLHIHDNAGRDDHLLPYEGNIDWNLFWKTLVSTGYDGALHLEASTRRSSFKEPEVFLSEARERLDRIRRSGCGSGSGSDGRQ